MNILDSRNIEVDLQKLGVDSIDKEILFEIFKKFLFHVLYMRNQIHIPFDSLESYVAQLRLKEKHNLKEKKLIKFVELTNKLLISLKEVLEFQDVDSIIVILGTSINIPKESYSITLPILNRFGENPLKDPSYVQKISRKIIRSFIELECLQETKPPRQSNIHIVIRYRIDDSKNIPLSSLSLEEFQLRESFRLKTKKRGLPHVNFELLAIKKGKAIQAEPEFGYAVSKKGIKSIKPSI